MTNTYGAYPPTYYGAVPPYGNDYTMRNPAHFQPTIPAQNPAPNTTGNSNYVWVQGEAGAKSFLVAANTTLLLMDSENTMFYLKSADASGIPMPLRKFKYTEISEPANTATGTPQSAIPLDLDKYVTRDELRAALAEITNARSAEKKTTEGNVNA